MCAADDLVTPTSGGTDGIISEPCLAYGSLGGEEQQATENGQNREIYSYAYNIS